MSVPPFAAAFAGKKNHELSKCSRRTHLFDSGNDLFFHLGLLPLPRPYPHVRVASLRHWLRDVSRYMHHNH